MSHEQNIKPQTLISDDLSTNAIEQYIDDALNSDTSYQEVTIHDVTYTVFKDHTVFNNFEDMAVLYYRKNNRNDLDILYDIASYETKADWKSSLLNTCHACENEDGFIIMYD